MLEALGQYLTEISPPAWWKIMKQNLRMCRPLVATRIFIQSISRAFDVCDELQILAGRIINALNIWNRLQHLVSHEWGILRDGSGQQRWCHRRPNAFQIWKCCDCLLNVWQLAECLFCLHHHRARRIDFDQIWQLRVIFPTLKPKRRKLISKAFEGGRNVRSESFRRFPIAALNTSVSTRLLTLCFHFMHWTNSSCIKWASRPRCLIFFGSSVWYLKSEFREIFVRWKCSTRPKLWVKIPLRWA